jgi:hypothetical protein
MATTQTGTPTIIPIDARSPSAEKDNGASKVDTSETGKIIVSVGLTLVVSLGELLRVPVGVRLAVSLGELLHVSVGVALAVSLGELLRDATGLYVGLGVLLDVPLGELDRVGSGGGCGSEMRPFV